MLFVSYIFLCSKLLLNFCELSFSSAFVQPSSSVDLKCLCFQYSQNFYLYNWSFGSWILSLVALSFYSVWWLLAETSWSWWLLQHLHYDDAIATLGPVGKTFGLGQSEHYCWCNPPTHHPPNHPLLMFDFGQKSLFRDPIFFGNPNFLGTQIFFRPKFFSRPKFVWDPNLFGTQICLRPKFVWDPNFWGPKFFGGTQIFWREPHFWGPTFFCGQN